MTEHTPGPWTVFEDYGQRTILGPDGESIIEIDNFGCESDPMPDHIAIRPGNAYLMAAAPDLLAACKAIIGMDNPPAGEPGHVDFSDAIKMVRAAITKATQE